MSHHLTSSPATVLARRHRPRVPLPRLLLPHHLVARVPPSSSRASPLFPPTATRRRLARRSHRPRLAIFSHHASARTPWRPARDGLARHVSLHKLSSISAAHHPTPPLARAAHRSQVVMLTRLPLSPWRRRTLWLHPGDYVIHRWCIHDAPNARYPPCPWRRHLADGRSHRKGMYRLPECISLPRALFTFVDRSLRHPASSDVRSAAASPLLAASPPPLNHSVPHLQCRCEDIPCSALYESHPSRLVS